MTRYQVLRRLHCDPITAGFIAAMNWLCGVPTNLIAFMSVRIEFDPKEDCP